MVLAFYFLRVRIYSFHTLTVFYIEWENFTTQTPCFEASIRIDHLQSCVLSFVVVAQAVVQAVGCIEGFFSR